MAKYSKKSQDKVEKTMQERKAGTLKVAGVEKSNKPQTGNCNWLIRSKRSRCKSAKEKNNHKEKDNKEK